MDDASFQPSPPATSVREVSALRIPIAARLVFSALARIRGGGIDVRLPGGETLRLGDGAGRAIPLRIHDYRFATRVLRNGDIGFAESWMAREWETPVLADLLVLLANNIERFQREFEGGFLGKTLNWLRHLANDNTRAGARRNILAHYDLGNAFYEAWLDASMTYSSARFDRPGADTLEAAQREKYRALAQHLDLRPGEHVLEIGCGWGGFAEVAAAEFGARVTGLTISDAQLAYARARMARLGLSDRVEIRRQDYRDVEGAFDKVASIEMFEAVGERHWAAYFAKIAGVLKRGGLAALQVITIDDALFARYRRRTDFIQRYVFPGGMLASPSRLREESHKAGLAWLRDDAFGASYAATLAAWTQRFEQAWPHIARLGFDDRFKRLWRFYLAYCEAGFRTGRTDVMQIALGRP